MCSHLIPENNIRPPLSGGECVPMFSGKTQNNVFVLLKSFIFNFYFLSYLGPAMGKHEIVLFAILRLVKKLMCHLRNKKSRYAK